GSNSNPAHLVHPRPSVDANQGAVPAHDLAKVALSELSIPPAWANATMSYDFLSVRHAPRWPLLLVPLVVVVVAAWRRRAFDELAGLALGLVGLVASIAGLLVLDDRQLQPWYLFAVHDASMALVAFGAWSGGRSLVAAVRFRRAARLGGAPTPSVGAWTPRLGVACVAMAVVLVASFRTAPIEAPIARKAEALTTSIAKRLPAGSRVLVNGPIAFDGYYSSTLVLDLDRAGFDVRVPAAQSYLFSPAMAAPAGWKAAASLVVVLSNGEPKPPETGAVRLAEQPIPQLLLTVVDRISVWQVSPPTS
ncbi:MAG TPA: hypothetical protein VGM93_10225, partial [Acidimicrobiales bacterium]